MPIAIRTQNVSKCYHIYDKAHERLLQSLSRNRKQYYREFWAVKNISLEIYKGQTVGIIGRNGSGKSTLLQMICGTLKPTSGAIERYGRIAALLELGSGFNPEFTGRENVYMNAVLYGLTKEEVDKRYEAILNFADIGDFINQPVKTYSSGMVLRLAFAVIVHVDADVLIIDEALSVGDTFFTQKCMRFLRDFMKKGTILFVSHDTASVKSLCNHAIWMEKGQLIQEGTPKEICERYQEAFVEAAQGKSVIPKLKEPNKSKDISSYKDQRAEFINRTQFRNDLRIFQFNPEAAAFGKGGAQICNAYLLDEQEHPLAWIVGGEKVTLRIIAQTNQSLDAPILGFYVKDRLGQALFGDNTFLTHREQTLSCSEGIQLQADFVFYMPILPHGDYTIAVAIANGTQESHEQHHWIHDAIVFKSESTSVSSGLIGIPMEKIHLKSL